jgi:hypothetical protein
MRAPRRPALVAAALREAELALAHTEIRAPFDAVVGRKNVEPGSIVAPGQPLLALAGAGESWVIANFKETQIREIQVGDRAEVTIDAFPGLLWRGHVDSFSPATGAKYALIPAEPAAGNFTRVVQRLPVFLINVPLGLLAAALCASTLRDPAAPRRGVGVDWAGIAFLVLGVGCLQTVLERGHKDDWFASPAIVWLSVGAAVGIVCFVARELTAAQPVVDLRVLRRPALATGCALGVLMASASTGASSCSRSTPSRCCAGPPGSPAWPCCRRA